MKLSLFSRLSRFVAAIAAAAVLAAGLPRADYAASVPLFSFTTIKASQSVTVHGQDFPKNTEFTVRMDVFGDLAVGGTIVGTVNSGSGSFDATFNIPSTLKDENTIAMRMDAAGGWYSYNWFTNTNSGGAVVTPVEPTPTTTTGKPYIDIVAVDKNKAITVQANRFPANQTFTIRVGPFKDFFKKYVVTGTLNSGSGGSFKFNVNLPDSVKDVDMITIRLDSSSGAYAFNAFKNVSSGTVSPVVTPTPAPTVKCEVAATTVPSHTMKAREDFDAVWTVKNNTGKTWDLSSVDYKFVSGTEMQKYGKSFDFKVTVKSGETVKIVVDMLAPDKAGTYTTNWAIVESGTTLCNLPLTVVVK
ncbi:MAG TPA: NBR1-Ig-like domain-containing protein [Anaerolinea sp.]|nr:NBR1-Ig-like domain-containing protein [Anaerolinea sp.]